LQDMYCASKGGRARYHIPRRLPDDHDVSRATRPVRAVPSAAMMKQGEAVAFLVAAPSFAAARKDDADS
jgi:hypothetical protein